MGTDVPDSFIDTAKACAFYLLTADCAHVLFPVGNTPVVTEVDHYFSFPIVNNFTHSRQGKIAIFMNFFLKKSVYIASSGALDAMLDKFPSIPAQTGLISATLFFRVDV